MLTENDARTAVETELDRLYGYFGAFEVTKTTIENDPEFYEHGLGLIKETGMLADAGALVCDSQGRVLLIRHPDAPDSWATPGGGYEAGDESLVATAVREVGEETTVCCGITGVRSARVKTIVHRDAQRSYPMLTVEFSARGDGPASAVDDEEILEARWFADPPADFESNG